MERDDSTCEPRANEIASNLVKGNIVIPNASFKWLNPQKAKLLFLTHKKLNLQRKKAVLNQKVGFSLSALASLIAPLATEW